MKANDFKHLLPPKETHSSILQGNFVKTIESGSIVWYPIFSLLSRHLVGPLVVIFSRYSQACYDT